MIRTAGGQVSDTGTRNIGVRETTDDLGNGGLDPFGFSLSVAVRDAAGTPLAADGTFKIPGLRNVELTAPYFHNGGERTLLDVVNFYARGGNLGGETNPIQTRDGTVIGGLSVLNFKHDSRRGGRESRPRRVPQVAHGRAGPHSRRRRSTIRRSSFRTATRATSASVTAASRTGRGLVARDPGHRPNGWPGAARLPGGLSSLRARRPALEAGRRASTLVGGAEEGRSPKLRASASSTRKPGRMAEPPNAGALPKLYP